MARGRRGFEVLCLAILLHAGISTATADVVFRNDGSVILGSLVEAQGSELVYDSMGTRITVPTRSILRTANDLTSLGDQAYDVTLADGTVFTGTIVDFDPEIGLFLNLSIGSLTLPSSGVKSIVDRQARRLWAGSDLTFSAAGFYTWFPDNAFFGSSFSASLGASARLAWRGWTAGLSLDWCPLEYAASSSVSYTLYSAIARLGYRVLDFRRSKSFLSLLSPYASLGAGPAYISVADSREGAVSSSYGSIAPQGQAELGFDISPIPSLSIRASGKASLILQAGSPFVGVGVGLAACWEIQ